jgi:hypothetical protein
LKENQIIDENISKEFADTHGSEYRKTSAKTGGGVLELFDDIANILQRKYCGEHQVSVPPPKLKEKSNKGCC